MLTAIVSIFVALIVVCIAMLCRNQAMYEVRVRFLDEDGKYTIGKRYNLLPSYDTMMYNFKYWNLWTYGQWSRYVDRQAILDKIRSGQEL